MGLLTGRPAFEFKSFIRSLLFWREDTQHSVFYWRLSRLGICL